MSVHMGKYRRYGKTPPSHPVEERLLALAREKGILRARDLAPHGIPRVILTRLLRRGLLARIGRGLYVPADADLSENNALAQVAKRVPHGIICLLSALRFHGLTTQSPHEVWIAIHVKARKPRPGSVPLQVVRFSGPALKHGVETHPVEGVHLRVTSPAKTVADCFKYRSRVGLDVAVEALKDYRRSRRSLDDLWRAARVCRVAAVLRPYLEAIA